MSKKPLLRRIGLTLHRGLLRLGLLKGRGRSRSGTETETHSRSRSRSRSCPQAPSVRTHARPHTQSCPRPLVDRDTWADPHGCTACGTEWDAAEMGMHCPYCEGEGMEI